MRHVAIRTIRIGPLILLICGICASAFSQTLPIGFVEESVTSGLTLPTAFTTLPDGRLLVTEKQGLVRVIRNDQLLATPLIDLRSSVNDYWDRGLIGIAADLDFASNGFVYLLHTFENDPVDYTGPKTGRLIRVTVSGDVAAPASIVTLLGTSAGRSCHDFPAGADCLPSDSPSHSVGNIKVAADGTLFVTSGDGADFNVVDDDALRSQDLDSLGGKMLHITTTGKGIPSNPFWTGDLNANRSKVWAYGLRNPFRFALMPGTNIPFAGDVGWNTWEEVNIINPLAGSINFGWPCYEGLYVQDGYAPKATCQALYTMGASAVHLPEVSWNHHFEGAAATGGVFYTGTSFPALYQGAYFYTDYALGFIRYFRVNGAGAISGPVSGFAVGLDGPVYLDTDGQNLLYVSVISGEIRRIRYTGAGADVSYLSDRDPIVSVSGYGPYERDQSNGEDQPADGRILTVGGTQYPKGLGVNSVSELDYRLLGSTCSQFAATVGVDSEVGANGSVVFQVFRDSATTPAYDSGLMTGTTPAKTVLVSLNGVSVLRLVVTAGPDDAALDHADWADARVTCTVADTTPPTVTTFAPSAGATAVAVNANVTGTFSEAMNPATLTVSTVTLVPQGSTTAVAAAVTYAAATNTVTLDPTGNLAGSTVYTATIKGGAAGAKDVAGNALTADRVWTFTTAASGTTVSYLSDRPWTTVANGWGPVEKDMSNGEDGAGDGGPLTLNGVSYAKGLGVHAASEVRFALGGACTQLTALVGVDDEVGANGSVVFQVFKDSATTPSYNSGVMTGATAAKSVSLNVAGVNTLRLVVTIGPDDNSSDHADWADAKVTCSNAGDTTPPTVTTVSPAASATAVPVNANVTATFSEAMNPATLTTATVTLVPQGSSTPVPAAVSFSAATNAVTLDPTADLAGSTVYTATIKGGAAGAKDVAGNALAADRVWTFTSAASGTIVTYLSDRPWTTVANGWGPVEKDMSVGQDGAGDGGPLTLNGVSFAKGLGTHAAADVRFALGAACSLLTASIGIDDEVGSNGSVVFQVFKDSATTASYDSGVMTGATATKNISVNVTGVNTLRLVVTNGGDDNSFDHADWADAKVTCNSAGDTTPPTVTATSPLSGAAGSALATTVTATFSEAMGPSTLTTTTFTLVPQGSATAVAATVIYTPATNSVTLDPLVDLAPSTIYTARIKGGASGAKDAFGNPLAADKVWSFTTDVPPTPTISQPVATFKFKVGDVITYAGAATDPEDGVLPGSSLNWSIVLFHCPGGVCHQHPFTTATGATGSFIAPDHGDESYFVITLTAIDSAGLTGTTSVTIMPQTLRFTLATSPTGLQVVYGGVSATAPATFVTIVGSAHTIQAPSPQGTLSFASWSDGGAQQHNVVVGSADVTYTATFADSTTPTVTAVTPTAGTTGVPVSTNVTGTFSEAMNTATLTTTTVTLVPQGSTTPVAAAVTYTAATNTVTLDPTVNLAATTVYTATIKGGAAGAKDVAGNALASDRVWTFTTSVGGTIVTYLSDGPWTAVANGWGPAEKDLSNGENGAGDGGPLTLNGVAYAKGLGVHAASDVRVALGGACSQFTSLVGVDDEVGVNGSVVFQVFADSAATPLYDSGTMTGSTATRTVSVNVAGVNTLRLVVTSGPDDNSFDHGDWADAKLTCNSVGDTTPPTVTLVGPAAAATAVPVNTNVTGTFSEAMNTATLTTATVTLVPQGSSTPVAAAVTYAVATNTVTLNPTADLAGNIVYTATIKGGPSGVKDVAGNPLAADRIWTFTTAASGTTATYLSDRPWTTVANGWGPVEKDMSVGQDAAGDGGPLTLNGVSYAKGLGVHAASEVRFALGAACSLLTASIGVDDEVGTNGSVVFQVFTDSATTASYDSGVMTGVTATRSVSVNVTGVNTLRLVVTNGGDDSFDHADWADAKVTCGSALVTSSRP